MSTLLSWVLAASAMMVPGRSHEPLAEAIVARTLAEPPLFRGDDDRKKTASLLVAIGFRESTLRPDAVGDMKRGQPTSFCAFQIHLPWGAKTPEGWSGPELASDPEKCVTVALRMIRESMRICPEYPLAFYAEGPNGCTSKRAQAISRDRLAIAQHLVRSVKVPNDDEVVSMMWPLGPLLHGTW